MFYHATTRDQVLILRFFTILYLLKHTYIGVSDSVDQKFKSKTVDSFSWFDYVLIFVFTCGVKMLAQVIWLVRKSIVKL